MVLDNEYSRNFSETTGNWNRISDFYLAHAELGWRFGQTFSYMVNMECCCSIYIVAVSGENRAEWSTLAYCVNTGMWLDCLRRTDDRSVHLLFSLKGVCGRCRGKDGLMNH